MNKKNLTKFQIEIPSTIYVNTEDTISILGKNNIIRFSEGFWNSKRQNKSDLIYILKSKYQHSL